MSQIIQNEVFFFLICMATGVLIMFGYDMLRALRQVFPHGNLLLAFEDFFFWSGAGILTFCVIFLKNSGILRGFSIGAILLGMMLYHKSVSRMILWGVSGILRLIVMVFDTIIGIITFPFTFLSKKMRKKSLKGLKNHIKEVKMTLYKK